MVGAMWMMMACDVGEARSTGEVFPSHFWNSNETRNKGSEGSLHACTHTHTPRTHLIDCVKNYNT